MTGSPASKGIVILGSTGSIGRQALEVAAAFRDRLEVVGLAAGGADPGAFAAQLEAWHPAVAALADPVAARAASVASGREVLAGPEGIEQVATWPQADLVLNAIVGFGGLAPTLAALSAGKSVALANKEPIVAAGGLILEAARRGGAAVIPVDSEPMAIFQLLHGRASAAIGRLLLTASGGPFYGRSPEELARVTPEAALRHPTWRMGPKITVDSATLMNKGFEVLEAACLFGVEVDRVDVLIHRRSLVHSLVELEDGAILAHLGPPDMRYPIQHALSYPDIWPGPWPRLDLGAAPPLEFARPDAAAFPCLNLAYHVGRIGKSLPAVLSAADEVAVAGFLSGRIRFTEIPRLLEAVVAAHQPFAVEDMGDAVRADAAGREAARALLERLAH